MTGPVIVAEWRRNAREVVRVTLDTFNGRDVVSARVWYAAQDGTMRPGRDGLTLAVVHVGALAQAFVRAAEEAERRGLVPPT
jgi:hypothetical protein